MINDAEGLAIESLALNYDNAGYQLAPRSGEIFEMLSAFMTTAHLTQPTNEYKSLGLAIAALSRDIVDFDQVSSHSNAAEHFLEPIIKTLRLNNEVARNVVLPLIKKVTDNVGHAGELTGDDDWDIFNVRLTGIESIAIVSELLEKFADADVKIGHNPIKYAPTTSKELEAFLKIGVVEYDDLITNIFDQWGSNGVTSTTLMDVYSAIYLNRNTAEAARIMAILQSVMGNNIAYATAFLLLAIGFNANIAEGAGVSLEDYRVYSLSMLQAAACCYNKAMAEYKLQASSGKYMVSIDFHARRFYANSDVMDKQWIGNRFIEGYVAANENLQLLTADLVKEKEKHYEEIGDRIREERRLIKVKQRDGNVLQLLYKEIIALFPEIPKDVLLYDDLEVCKERLAEAMKKNPVGDYINVARLATIFICETYIPQMAVKDILLELQNLHDNGCYLTENSETKNKPTLQELAVISNMRYLARWMVQYVVAEPKA